MDAPEYAAKIGGCPLPVALLEIVPFELLQVTAHAELCLGQLFHALGETVDADDQSVKALGLRVHMGGQLRRLLGQSIYMLGKLPMFPAETLDHSPRARQAPMAAVTPDYGRYVAQSCTGCHGGDFGGGIVVVPGKPASANLTPHDDGLAKWSEGDFLRLMQSGHRPDGSAVDPLMPWAVYTNMDEIELRAMWAYLRTIEPVPARGELAQR